MSDPQPRTQVPRAADPGELTWRRVPGPRSRPGWLPLLLGLAVLGLATGVPWLAHRENERNGPEATARAYLQLLAEGHADHATREVPPVIPNWVTPAPDLLTDAVLGSATARPVIESVTVYEPDVEVGEDTDVTVEYSVGRERVRTEIPVRREPNTLGVLKHWRVVGSLAVPVRVQTNVETLTRARIGDTTMPVAASSLHGFPQTAVLLYPGSYPLRGVESPWVTADSTLTVHTDRAATQTSLALPNGQVWYAATDALWDTVRREAEAQVRQCAAAGATMDRRRCPSPMALRNDWGTLRVTEMPQIDVLQSFQSDYKEDGSTLPMLRFRSGNTGRFTYSGGGAVDPGDEEFYVDGGVTLSPDGKDADVRVWSSLSGPGA